MEICVTSRVATAETITLLVATSLPRVGPVAIRKIVAAVNGGIDTFQNYLASCTEVARSEATTKCRSMLEACSRSGIWVVSVLDESYPQRLRTISDYPPVLFGRGALDALDGLSIAVVGTRKASKVGLSHASRIAGAVVQAGGCVVSGLALGIDTAAHRGALNAGGKTVAVMAHGLDTVSPSSNKRLAEEIVETGGALISEHPPGVRPYPPEFVRRNRIQSGMALASIMVESGEEGGSIHQARFTKQQGRPLFAVVPSEGLGSNHQFDSAGAIRVQREFGAKPIETREDLMAALKSLGLSADA